MNRNLQPFIVLSLLLSIFVSCHNQDVSPPEAGIVKGNSAPNISAEAGKRSSNTAPNESRSSDARSSAAEEIQFQESVFRNLQQKVNWHLNDETLAGVAERFSGALKIQVFLDRTALKSAGVDPATKINRNFDDVTLDFALENILRELGLDWTIVDNLLLITSREIIEENLTTRVYDVADLVSRGEFDQPDFDSLIDTIQSHVFPKSWAENGGGEASVRPFQSSGTKVLVVSQTLRAHHKLAKLLSDLRNVRDKRAPAEANPTSIEDLRDKLSILAQQRPSKVGGQPNGDAIAGNWEAKLLSLKSARLDDAARRCNEFSLELFHEAAIGADQNALVSGYSAREALLLVALGSAGETEDEFTKMLKLPDDRMTAAIEVLSLRSHLREAESSGNRFQVGNSLWIQHKLKLKDEFSEMTDKFMGASAHSVDFRHPGDATAQINRWVAENTQQRIKEILAPSDVTPKTFLLVANTVYFLGKWEKSFDAKNTGPREFTLSNGKKTDVQMMNGEVTARYGVREDIGLQIAELPYRGKSKSMVILLPAKREGSLAQLERMLDAGKLQAWLVGLQVSDVTIHLPKFSFRDLHDLNAPLRELGGRQMFELRKADFSGISTSPLALQDVLQQTFIQVDESGTEAAAATAVNVFGGVAPAPKPELIVDHPFLLLIRDAPTGCILFVGRVMDPRPDK